jgi:poly(hydroxyalkanoate) depolymerase family esterase
MKKTVYGAMLRATRLVKEQNLVEATQGLLRALSPRDRVAPSDMPSPETPRVFELQGVETPCFKPPPQDAAHGPAPKSPLEAPRPAERQKQPLGDLLNRLRRGELPNFDGEAAPLARLRKSPPVAVPDGARYLSRRFACAAGARDYKLYVPSHAEGGTRPLIVMLHGCTQNPDDFALGTGMNALAEELGFVVAYPAQSTSANQMACWNWFDQKHQTRESGEPSIIAGMTRAIIAEFGIDAARVFVAGLSAGGAMAEIMGVTYPDLFAATGVHSGLAYGSASDAASAFAVMSGGSSMTPGPGRPIHKRPKGHVRTIVFHGDSDRKVHPSNAEKIHAEARMRFAHLEEEAQLDGFAGGRAYSRIVIRDARGVPHAEHWAIDGLGHAWSGGNEAGSHTDPFGPDASREMLRFFLESGC